MKKPTGIDRRQALGQMGALTLLLGAGDLAFGASVVAVRVWPAADYTRVTIESDTPLAQRHFMAENPSRLVIDIDGLELSPALRDLTGKVRADDPFIAGVRAGQNQVRVVRLVIDLKQPSAPQLFTLAPVAAYQNRLVFDLYPAVERNPLLAPIHDREQAEQLAARTVQDALGEFIGKVDKPGSALPLPGSALPGPAQPPMAAAAAPLPPLASVQRPAALPPASPQTQTPVPLLPAVQGKIDRLIVVALDPGHGGEARAPSAPAACPKRRGARRRAATARPPEHAAQHARHADPRRRLLRAAG